jgi:hypothetical protein
MSRLGDVVVDEALLWVFSLLVAVLVLVLIWVLVARVMK